MLRSILTPLAALSLALTPAVLRADVTLTPVWTGDAKSPPVALAIPPDGTNRHFLVQQRGVISVLAPGLQGEGKTALDISDRKMEENQFEEGLLGLAFHPKFKENGLLYIYYSQQDPKHSVVSEFKISAADPDKIDPATERVLLEVPQPYWNHNSGNLAFGPDGMLYIPFGDGGKGGDPLRLAQNTFVFNGKMLRIDVNTRTGSRPYGIPSDNPFVGKEAVRPEIWATGLRNPWGISFDKETGLFWCADVGQDLWEEIDLIERGGNYGWSFREGEVPFVGHKDAPPEKPKFVEPVAVYSRDKGISVTGGFVYRGEAMPGLKGCYLYGDWGSGRIWALRYDDKAKKVTENKVIFEQSPDTAPEKAVKPTAFVPDEKGEVLVLSWNGLIFRMKE